MKPDIRARVLKAINFIEKQNMGVDSAARKAGTDRRTVYKYLQQAGKEIIRSGTGKNFKITIQDLPKQKGSSLRESKEGCRPHGKKGYGYRLGFQISRN